VNKEKQKNQLQLFRGKSVVVTGHTGFKGSWLAAWLWTLGAKVVGVARDTPSEPSHFEVAGLAEALEDNRFDIREGDALKRLVLNVQPDFVFHLAAQPLVRQSFLDPVETYQTNVLGTLNLLEALRPMKKRCTAVLITSDKCYDNVEWVWGYRETDALGGPDPYSASKGAAELVIRSHVKSFFPKDGPVRVAVGRAGNVIGGGDWAGRNNPICCPVPSANDVSRASNRHANGTVFGEERFHMGTDHQFRRALGSTVGVRPTEGISFTVAPDPFHVVVALVAGN
jgi:CDP-glucose 4,6-dehydratase